MTNTVRRQGLESKANPWRRCRLINVFACVKRFA